MIDIHCHLEYMKNREEVVAEARERMLAVITSVADIKHKDEMIKLCEANKDFLFLTLGLHPEHIFYYKQKDIDNYIEFIHKNHKKIVGLGEVGLDYNRIKDPEKHTVMKNIFAQFIGISNELKLPLVIHSRSGEGFDAFQDVMKILTDSNVKKAAFHCFSGAEKDLKYALEQNYMISYATILCKSKRHKRLAAETPIENIVFDTDSPWLDPFSNELKNMPWNVMESAKVVAEIKNIPVESVLTQTTENAKKFFDLKI